MSPRSFFRVFSHFAAVEYIVLDKNGGVLKLKINP